MTLNTVTLKWDVSDLVESGVAATLSITPAAQMSDATDHVLIPPVPRQVTFTGGTGQLPGIVANDNSAILPAGTGYLISVTAGSQVIVPQFQTQINYASGATQWLDQLATVPVVTTSYQYLPLPSGTPSAGQAPVSTGAGEASAWTTPTGTTLGAPAVYAPGTQATLTVSSTTMTAFSSANVSTGTFTAPPSGHVLVTATFTGAGSAASTYTSFGLADHGTTNMRGYQYQTEVSSTGQAPVFTLQFMVTGLTPGGSYDFDLMGATSGGTFSVYAIGQTTATPVLGASGRGGPVTMMVQAAM